MHEIVFKLLTFTKLSTKRLVWDSNLKTIMYVKNIFLDPLPKIIQRNAI